tara:strand:- start:368 stop:703 length:336 start_codon:yes stop_codon:yes gene_type:complete
VEKDMTVYIVQEMRGRDLSDALAFGELEILLPSSEQTSYSTQPTLKHMNRVLSRFCDDDYLLLAGDPAAIALAAALVAKINNGKFKMLKWDRKESKYFPLHVSLNAPVRKT